MTARRWRWALVPVLVIPIGWLLFTGLGRDPSEIGSPLVGRPLPTLAGTTLAGEYFSTDEATGRPMLVNVWASWCIPACVDEHPLLLSAAADHPELAVVGVLYQDTPDDATGFLARWGDGGWPNLLDTDSRLAIELGATGPPETYFVDADGIVRWHQIGPLTEDLLAEQLAAIGVTGP